MRFWIAAAISALMVVACADLTVPTAPIAHDSEGKQFAAPPNGKAAIYLYSGPKAAVSGIVMDRRYSGLIGPRTWMRFDVDAGAHELQCAFKDDHRGYVSSSAAYSDPMTSLGAAVTRPFDAAAGNTYYFDIGFRAQWTGGLICTIAAVDAAAGRAGVLSGQRALQQISP